jgi:OCT family organic cation transporter-like MFS transporter 3
MNGPKRSGSLTIDDLKTAVIVNKAQPEKITFCSNKIILFNLILMVILWSVSSLDYYLITFFMKYVPGNLYVNTTVSTISELIAYIFSGFVYNAFGGKKAFIISFALSATGGFLIAFVPASGYLIASFVLLAKFGISFAFNLVYLITPTLFPVELTTTAFGICNVFARFSTILSPILAELTLPTPMLCYGFTSIAAMVASMFIVTGIKYQ